MQKSLQIVLSIFLSTSLLFGNGHAPRAAAAETDNVKLPSPAEQAVRLEQSYTDMLQQWSKLPAAPRMEVVVNPSANPANSHLVVAKSESFGYPSDSVRFQKDSQVKIQVEVPETGLYQVAFDYFTTDDSILSTEGYIQVNGQFPFYESRRILFPNLWEEPQTKEKLDRYGNELLPRPGKMKVWQHTYAMDASYYYLEPLQYKLEKGSNTITIVNTRGDLLLGNVTVNSRFEIQNYDTYRKQQPAGNGTSSIDKPIVIEAEKPVFKNDSSIRAVSEQDPKLTPYETSHKRLNALGGFSWEDGGQSVTWEMDAPQDGYYKIALKYRQSALHDMPVFRQVEIDGKVPFQELHNAAFQYCKKWKNQTLGKSDDQPYEFYLTKGKHTLTMTVNLDQVRPLAEMIVAQMKEISRLTLEIRKLTGNKTDLYRDWSLHEYIPDLDKTLNRWADQLEAQYKKLNQLNPEVSEISELVNLKMAVSQLRSLAKDPDKLPNRMTLFSEGSASVSQQLGDLLQRISQAPLDLDKIYLYQKGDLPKANAGFFDSLWESIKRFFLSFTSQSYSASAASSSELNVWVNRPRPYVELLQKMVDEQFTPQTGISVKLSLMPDQNKLILANASGSAPDVALGVDNWIPYELAIRNAAIDLRKFNDYDKVIKQFSKGAIIPFTFENGVYALPETQDFWVLFYRKDILDNLKLGVPSTWNDVVKMLPELQRLGMNFYEPLALSGGFKPFSATTPFIYQFGGELFTDDGMHTAIDSEKSLEGIKFMTDLFTIYNVPQSVPNFYNHFRYGTLPVGISNFTTYIQLKAAAPEIANAWKIAPHPGVEKDGVVQRWASSGGQTGMILKGSKHEQESWDFLKWWLSKDTQVGYANQMQTAFGPTFMWNTANLDAFTEIPWPEEDKKVILEQYKWVREASRVPGAYMVEREISSAWNSVVFNGTNPRTAVDDGVIRANREITKKMEEFGYYKDGRKVKPYPVPTINSIDKWVEKR